MDHLEFNWWLRFFILVMYNKANFVFYLVLLFGLAHCWKSVVLFYLFIYLLCLTPSGPNTVMELSRLDQEHVAEGFVCSHSVQFVLRSHISRHVTIATGILWLPYQPKLGKTAICLNDEPYFRETFDI